jgi:hypothetical protein
LDGLMLGFGFLWSDLLCYALGAERLFRRKKALPDSRQAAPEKMKPMTG